MTKTAPLPKRTRGRPHRTASWAQVNMLREKGLSFRAIAEKLGFGYGTIRRVYSSNGSNTDEHANPS